MYYLSPVKNESCFLDFIAIGKQTFHNVKFLQEPIARKVIEQGMFVKHCKVEVYLMDLKLCQNSEIDNHVLKQFSRADTIGT